MSRKTWAGLRVALSFIMAGVVAGTAAAESTYPDRPIRLLTPYSPGSMVDITSRKVAEGLSKRLGQPVVVENRAGGMGLIAMNAMLNAPADGYTLMADTPASAINPSLYPELVNYDPKKDVAPVAQFMSLPFVLSVNADMGVNTVDELVAKMKESDGAVNASVAGTSTGLVTDLFAQLVDAKFTQIPYKGASAALLATLRGEAPVLFLDIANLTVQINEGKLKGLLISGPERSPALPDVPTATEAGVPDFTPVTWFGMFARGDTPPEILEQLNATVREIMASEDMQQYVNERGATPSDMSLEEFAAFYNQEIDTWAKVNERAQPTSK